MIDSPLLETGRLGSFIGGEWTEGGAEPPLSVRNPANGDLLANVPAVGVKETELAVLAADKTARETVSLEERKVWLEKIVDALSNHRDELGRIITLEQGKPLAESLAEVDYSVGFFRFYANCIDELKPERLDTDSRGCEWWVHPRPAGVAASITPWNFPLAMFAKKLAPALAAGCGMVAKPSSKTPLSMIALHRLAEKIGIPPGRMNLLVGLSGPIGKTLCEHPAVRVISCTSSTDTGKTLLSQAANHVKRVSLELGGNAPYMVCEDADLVSAADGFIANKFRASGQTCVCANRVLVQREVEEEFCGLLAERIAMLKVGDGLDEGVEVGPLIDRGAFDNVAELLADALDRGATRVVGDDPRRPEDDFGAFFPPTLLAGVNETARAYREEIFGPLVIVTAFDTDEELIARANDTEYGLASYLFTADRARGERIAAGLRFGHVGMNTGTGPTPEAPFGGFKCSGLGREGGIEGLFEYTETQTIAIPRR